MMQDNSEKVYSIIIPVLNEAAGINDLIGHLNALGEKRLLEILVVDGTPEGDTLRAIQDPRVRRILSPSGRARQMNAGAAQAGGEVLVFLHADTRLPREALKLMDGVLHESHTIGGAFDLCIASNRPVYRIISVMASFRSRLTRIPYGDQAIFIRAGFFHDLGGYPDIPLMEDVALMRKIKKTGGRIGFISQCVSTSPRRWEKEGIIYTTLRNWTLLIAYLLGVPPERLARAYRGGKAIYGA